MRLILEIALILSLAAESLCAAPSDAIRKQPWQWSRAERVAGRKDPLERLERLRLREQTAGSAPAADVFDASTNPELFSPTELFESLVRFGFVMLPDTYQHVVAQRSSDLFRDPSNWKRFGVIVHEYALLLGQENAAAGSLDARGVSRAHESQCAVAAQALREARREFGRARFDRMLYETARLKRTFSLDTDLEAATTRALQRDERCQ